MKYKSWLLIGILVLGAIIPAGLAESALQASWEGDIIVVCWTGCTSNSAELTVYQNGWPVLVTRVDCAAGRYTVPASYTAAAGKYSVRLRTASGCVNAEVAARPAESAATATPAITQPPVASTPVPTAKPEATPRQTAAPTPSARPTATPAPTQPAGSADSSLAGQVAAQVNRERAALGLGPLRVDADLTAAACVRAREIAQVFSHTRPDGRSWSTVSSKAYAENIAMGQNSADKVMAAWMSSPSHKENILRPSLGSIGVCALRLNGVLYWVQLFGK